MADPENTEGTETEPTDDQTDQADSDNGDEDDAFDKERAMRTIRALREDVKKARADGKRTAELEARLRELEDANKTEEQRRIERLAELEKAEQERQAELRNVRLENAVLRTASSLQVTDPALAYRAIDPNVVEYDDHGAPTNIEAVLTEVLERHPALKARPADSDGPPAKRATGTDSGTDKASGKQQALTADELEAAKALGMTPERYAAVKGKRTVTEVLDATKRLDGQT